MDNRSLNLSWKISVTATKKWVFGILAVAASTACFAVEDALQPFTGTYAVEWRGMNAGTSTLELIRLGGNDYSYRSRNVARGFFRLAFPDAITQTSNFSLVDGVVRPASYRADDGSTNKKRAIALDFDWNAMRVTGMAEGKPVDQPLKPGTQDSLSVQIALLRELAAGRLPRQFWLINKDEVTNYDYVREGTEILDTPLGKLETVMYRSQRTGSSRTTRLWFAPSLGYLPVRAQQLRRGKPEFALTIRALTRN
jgi:hypothetical protein